MCMRLALKLEYYFAKLGQLEFIAPLAMRLYLAPIFWMAGMQKWQHLSDTIAWFGNTEWGLGLPFPVLMAYAATITELLGAIFLVLGLATRLISFPLMIVMIVAAMTVHLDNGWLAIAPDNHEAMQRLEGFLHWLESHYPGRHRHITELGEPVILNNGVEFAVTYLIMLLSLCFTGPGRYCSLDDWIKKRCHRFVN